MDGETNMNVGIIPRTQASEAEDITHCIVAHTRPEAGPTLTHIQPHKRHSVHRGEGEASYYTDCSHRGLLGLLYVKLVGAPVYGEDNYCVRSTEGGMGGRAVWAA